MNKFLFSIFFFSALFISACKGTVDEKTDPEAKPQDMRNIYTGEDGHTVGIDVRLNNGAKWEANIETTREIGAMVGMVKDLPAHPTLEDYRGLKKRLAVSFQTIFQKCTMQGEAHDQLHAYLIPLKEKIDRLEDCTPESCSSLTTEIRDYLLKYSHFFFS